VVVRGIEGVLEDVNAFVQSCLVQPSAIVGDIAAGINK